MSTDSDGTDSGGTDSGGTASSGTAHANVDAVWGERRQLINLAYRLLGSLADAEDVVQEAYARWFSRSAEEQDVIASPGAWLTTVTSRLCLNLLTSARVRRETYVGEWIPEPVPDSTQWMTGRPDDVAADPADRVSLDESLNMAFLVVLEAMTPAERVAFILHDVFRYSFAEVGEIVGRSPGACRQLASSARHRLSEAHTTTTPTRTQAAVVRRFKTAWDAGDIDALIDVLAPDVTVVSDGGGRVSTIIHPISGAERIGQAFLGLQDKISDLTVLERTVNGQPGLIARRDGVTVSVYAFEVAGDRISRIWAIRNPDKLVPWMETED
ncbi:RNA polymerase sigma factor SigJ [Planctomonas sp. JC2975]|uniref:RNA polymerase sigma factor SigJ n=1 Tax=Planctomonas sp. JC2975 TaxID=2729626 RepID=UPI0014755EB0|nr:RNA polymerase sigma factor SigJ [Planctomonas sp. JC2975]NNC13832.1 RNA polymerase sigma factor SigJ [Planctomonas sp. JC2975]